MLLHSDLSNGMLSFLTTSFAGEAAAVAIVAGRGDSTYIWFMRALFRGCLQTGLPSAFSTHRFRNTTLEVLQGKFLNFIWCTK